MQIRKNTNGFTLLEILLVVAAIGILAGIVILAINPNKQLGDTRDAQRKSDVNVIVNAMYQYSLDNNGSFPSAIDSVTASSQILGTAGSGCDSGCTDADGGSTVAACADTTADLVPDYLVSMPFDPASGSLATSDYYINKDANNRLVVGACDPEQADAIEVVR